MTPLRRESARIVIAAIAIAASGFFLRLAGFQVPSTRPTGAALNGQVVTSGDHPVRRAHIVASGPTTLTGDTDPDGRFHLEGLAKGTYTLATSKAGFVAVAPSVVTVAEPAGQLDVKVLMTPAGVITGRVLDSAGVVLVGAPVALRQGNDIVAHVMTDDRGVFRFHTLQAGTYEVVWSTNEKRTETAVPGRAIDIELVSLSTRKAGAVSASPATKILAGRVVDEFGDPAPDVTVVVAQSIVGSGKPRLLPLSDTLTDDLGEFRLRDVPFGTFFVMALSGPFATTSVMAGPSGPQHRGYGFALTFFPGTARLADAQPVTIDAREITSPVVFAMVPSDMGRVSGRVIDPSGPGVGRANIILFQLHNGDLRMFVAARASTDDEGFFSIDNVPAGSFVAQAFGRGGFAAQTLMVSPPAAAEVALTLTPPSAIRGRLLFDGALDQSLLKKIRIAAFPTDLVQGPAGRVAEKTVVNDDGTFEVSGLLGLNKLIFDIPLPWTLGSISSAGVDITDQPIDSRVGDVDDLQVRFAPNASTVVCRVTDRDGRPASGSFVLIFPQDAALTAYPSRWVRGVTADQTGNVSARALPPGLYRAVAFERPPRPDWMNPDYIETLRPVSEGFTVRPGESVTVRLARR